MFGDIGQIEWFKTNPSPRNDNFDTGSCTLTYDMTLGLTNFRRLACMSYDYLKNANIMSIAGDVLYPETAKALATANISMANNSDYNANRPIKVNNTFPDYVQWNARVQCGWKGVRAIFENYVNWCGKQLPPVFQETGTNFLALQLVEGNHSFDVDINIEAAEMLKLGNNIGLPVNETLKLNSCNYDSDYNNNLRTLNLSDQLLYPKLTTSRFNGVKVQFLDANTYFFSCGVLQNQTAYDACTAKQNFYKYYSAYPTFAQSSLYVLRYLNALSNMDPTANWRITRGHHAMFTIDDADMKDFFYTPFIYNGKNYGLIVDAIKAANIHFHIASHMHLTYLLAFPYYNNVLKNSVFNRGNRTTVTSGCYDAASYFTNSTASSNKTSSYSCLSGQSVQLSINSKTPEYFLQFTIGSSGRAFDQLIGDDLTVGQLLWGRSMFTNSNPNFGGYYIEFGNTSATLSYFEIQAQTSSIQSLNNTQDYNQFAIATPYTFIINQNNNTNTYPNIDNAFFAKFNCANSASCANLTGNPPFAAIGTVCPPISSDSYIFKSALAIFLIVFAIFI
jgi:hypothetical protein